MTEPQDDRAADERRERDETFSVIDDYLIRFVTPARGRGKPYEHRCSRRNYEAVVHAIDALGDAGCRIEDLVRQLGIPHSQAAVALAFLKERGCVVTQSRRSYPATGDVYSDAMIEYFALKDQPEE